MPHPVWQPGVRTDQHRGVAVDQKVSQLINVLESSLLDLRQLLRRDPDQHTGNAAWPDGKDPRAPGTQAPPDVNMRTESRFSTSTAEDGDLINGSLESNDKDLSGNDLPCVIGTASAYSSMVQWVSDSSSAWLPIDPDTVLGEPESAPPGHSQFQPPSMADKRWFRLVQLTIKLGRSKASILHCWTPSTDDPVLHVVLESSLKPVGYDTQHIDELWQTWNAMKHKVLGINARTASWELGSVTDNYARNRFVAHPLSVKRDVWSTLGLLSISYDAAMISLSVFDFEITNVIKVIDWTLRVYWLLDIGLSFRTGFYIRNDYVDSSKAIAKHYLSTWFAIDVIAVVPDWIVTVFETRSSVGDYSQTFRYLKAFKMLRLLRVAKSAAWIQEFLDSLNSIIVLITLKTIKSSVMVILWVHACACIWYGLAKKADDSWIKANDFEHFKLPETYFLSLQWSLAQLQGSSDIIGSNSASERAIHSLIVMISIFVLAIFTSNVTNNFIQLQNTMDNRAQYLKALKNYLARHDVSIGLSESVRKYCVEKLRIERKLHFGDDDVTDLLPKSLRRALLVEVRARMIKQNSPCFVAFSRYLPKSFERLCCDALKPFFGGPDNIIFHYSEKCTTVYFNVAGQLIYDHVSNVALSHFIRHLQGLCNNVESTPSNKSPHEMVTRSVRERMHEAKVICAPLRLTKCQSICEAAMWTHWVHGGDMRSLSHTAFLTLDSSDFSILVEHDVLLQRFGLAHAIRWCRVLNYWGEVSDLMTTNDILEQLYQAGELAASNRGSVDPSAGTSSRSRSL